MAFLVLAFLGGILTIASPCVLPVLPFVFSRANQPFSRGGLPLLAGMALMFAVVASLAAVGGHWVVAANQYGRWAAMGLLVLFALALLMPRLAARLSRPLVRAGDRLSRVAEDGTPGRAGTSFLMGIATGLLWTPCAGPILGLVLTLAALRGAGMETSLMLLAYAIGAATSLGLALFLGGRVFRAMKRSLGAGEWVRRGLGVAMLAGVGAIASGLDTTVLAQVALAPATNLEQRLVHRLADARAASPAPEASRAPTLPDEGAMPPLDGATQWLNTPPLTADGLKGKVVMIDFWTYSCINCLRTLPYTVAWADKYRDAGLVVIGVHTPEFAFERDVGNVKRAIRRLGIPYPVALDNDYTIWRAFSNRYWPAHYFVDARGRIRHHQFGEGDYDRTEEVIRSLLRDAGATHLPDGLVSAQGAGVQQAPDFSNVRSPETYLGYARAERFSSGAQQRDEPHEYSTSSMLPLNGWGLFGTWTVGEEQATLDEAAGGIVYRFHARDLNLVLSPPADGSPVRFKVTLDGQPPGDAHGTDVAADGTGVVTEQRLYQLIRQDTDIQDRTFGIEFETPGGSAYAFTFG